MNIQSPFTKILLPLDGSERSKRAVQFTGHMRDYMGGNISGITLLHVIQERYSSRHLSYIDFRAENLKQSDVFKKIRDHFISKEVMPFLDEGEKILKGSGIGVEIEKHVLEGDPAHEIVRLADEGKFSTIIMARRGLSKIAGLFMGSVTSKVIGHAPCNVLVVPLSAKDKIENILIATDGSRYSTAAALQAIEIAKRSGANLIVTSVVPSETGVPLDIVQSEMQRELIAEEELKEAEKNVRHVKELAEKEGLNIPGLVLAGRPYEAIVETAKQKDIDLIVIGSHGKTGFERLFMGSVAERVIILSH
ncbi:MAG: universal stress protein, partial [Nitrospirota bacterium]|nr:universal stress protein [Nitrospirota bacterium]